MTSSWARVFSFFVSAPSPTAETCRSSDNTFDIVSRTKLVSRLASSSSLYLLVSPSLPSGSALASTVATPLTPQETLPLESSLVLSPSSSPSLTSTFLTAFTGWGLEVFSFYNQWWVVPIFATHLGAIVGAWLYYIAVGE